MLLAGATRVPARGASLAAVRRRVGSHPEVWVYALAALAWVPLIAAHGRPMIAGGPGGWAGVVVASALMAVGMMAPIAAPAARYVALAGRADRRVRGPATFVAAYLAAWTAVALAMMLAVAAASALAGPILTPLGVAAMAVAWQLSGRKRRALARCGRHEPMGRRGWRADVACARFGFRSARACIVACAGLMAIAIASGHELLVVGAVFLLQVRERLDRRYDARFGARMLAALALAVVVTSGGWFASTASAAGVAVGGSTFVCRIGPVTIEIGGPGGG